jgi:hypothetical protein
MMANTKNAYIDDETIKKQIKEPKINIGKRYILNIQELFRIILCIFLSYLSKKKNLKRLRHETTKTVFTADKGTKNYYQMLPCFEYNPNPTNLNAMDVDRIKNENKLASYFQTLSVSGIQFLWRLNSPLVACRLAK